MAVLVVVVAAVVPAVALGFRVPEVVAAAGAAAGMVVVPA